MADKTDVAVVVGKEPAPAVTKKYNVVGLAMSDNMPLEHNGVMYNLAKLTDPQAEQLVADGCTHLVRKS